MLTLAACAFCLSSKLVKMLLGTLRRGSGITGSGGVARVVAVQQVNAAGDALDAVDRVDQRLPRRPGVAGVEAEADAGVADVLPQPGDGVDVAQIRPTRSEHFRGVGQARRQRTAIQPDPGLSLLGADQTAAGFGPPLRFWAYTHPSSHSRGPSAHGPDPWGKPGPIAVMDTGFRR